jgi:hypothetical protein
MMFAKSLRSEDPRSEHESRGVLPIALTWRISPVMGLADSTRPGSWALACSNIYARGRHESA